MRRLIVCTVLVLTGAGPSPAFGAAPTPTLKGLLAHPPAVGPCHRGIVTAGQIAVLCEDLAAIDADHGRIFYALALDRPSPRVPASYFATIFPYSWNCSAVEPLLFFAIEQLRRDAETIGSYFGAHGPVENVTVRRRGRGNMTRLPGAVEPFFLGLLASLKTVHEADAAVMLEIGAPELIRDTWQPPPGPARLSLQTVFPVLASQLSAIREETEIVRLALEGQRGRH